MGKVDPKVAKTFESELKKAVSELAKWEKDCAQAQEDYKSSHTMTISEAIQEADASKKGALSKFPGREQKPRFDLTKKRPPISPSMAKELGITGDIEKRKKKCDETIEAIKKRIEDLNKSRTQGTATIKHLSAALRKEPKFVGTLVTKLSRGELLLVLERKGDWFRVKAGDTEGWVHKVDITEPLPIKLTSDPGGPSPNLTPEQKLQSDSEQMGGRG